MNPNSPEIVRETHRLFANYLSEQDWRTKENANTGKSINGLNNYIRESFIEKYWLYEVYPTAVSQAHVNGDIHIHDLGFWGPYCTGWNLGHLLLEGFCGAPGKIETRPAKHLRSFLGQLVNATCTTQGEFAGAQAWGSFDTYCAPFIRADSLSFSQVKQALQEFVFSLNTPTRVGFQCPFSNLTFDLMPRGELANHPVIIGGETIADVYGDFAREVDMFNRAFCEVMLEGDAKGRGFTFPIPTVNVTTTTDWEGPGLEAFLRIACKYGNPYFANYINSGLSPDDIMCMCCHLQVDMTKLHQRGGGLFASHALTGSIGVVTINLPRIGHLCRTEQAFMDRLRRMVQLGLTALEMKREVIEIQTEKGLYPYSAHYLSDIKGKTGRYWANHFGTIGIVGMNEAVQNLLNKNLGAPEAISFAQKVLGFMRDILIDAQEKTGNLYNLEATPAESAAYRLARLDKERYPNIITAGRDVPYYTNSSHLPVGYSDDIFEVIELQDELQSLYTGGTVQHLYLGESIEDFRIAKRLVKRIFERYKLPYLSLTPTFSVCPNHGYLRGEHVCCPACGVDAEIWSRVTGYLRPVANFNEGKKAEYLERMMFVLPELEQEKA